MAREMKTRSAAIMLIVIIAAILLVINLIGVNVFSRLDLTESEIYTLSPASKNLVSDLKDRLTIKAYITDDLPSPHNADARYLKDLLDDYKAYSDGNISYEIIDPAKENVEMEASNYRIPAVQFNVYRNDKTEFIKGYKGLVLLYGEKQERIPFIENTQNLEYDLSRAIKKMTAYKQPFVGFTIGNGEPDMTDRLATVYQVLQQEYKVQFMNLENLRNLPNTLDALFIVSPIDKMSEWELYLIDQFIMRGGKVAFLVDQFDVDIQQSVVTPVDNGLNGLLNWYGIGFKENLVIDQQCNMVPVVRTIQGYRVQTLAQYPFYLKVTNFAENNPVVKDLQSLDILYTSEVDLDVPIQENVRRFPLFFSSDLAGARTLPVDISPEKQYVQSDFGRSNIPLAAILTGRFGSLFEGRQVPAFPGPDSIDVATAPPDFLTLGLEDARLAVVGSGTFITDDIVRSQRSAQAGLVFLLNLADWMTQEEGLISIRSRSSTVRTLDPVTDGNKALIKYLNIAGMPLLVILVGLFRWQIRRTIRKREASR